jgi:hypothetical protein
MLDKSLQSCKGIDIDVKLKKKALKLQKKLLKEEKKEDNNKSTFKSACLNT